MSGIYYRFEILPTEEGREFYRTTLNRSPNIAGVPLFAAKDCFCPYNTGSGNIRLNVAYLEFGCKARMIRCYPDETEEEVHYFISSFNNIYKEALLPGGRMEVIDKKFRGELITLLWAFINLKEFVQRGTSAYRVLAPDLGWIKEVVVVNSFNDDDLEEDEYAAVPGDPLIGGFILAGKKIGPIFNPTREGIATKDKFIDCCELGCVCQ